MEMNPMQFIQLIKSGNNPQQLALSMLQQSEGGPLMSNLLSLAQSGNTREIENIARNLARERGLDYDKEFEAFKKNFGF